MEVPSGFITKAQEPVEIKVSIPARTTNEATQGAWRHARAARRRGRRVRVDLVDAGLISAIC
jgi:hypothetical protein